MPALFQQSVSSGNDVYKNARKAKAKEYPLRDSQGRRNNPSPCLPFILTSMGRLCSEGHAFLKICRHRNSDRADLLLDVLVTQHSRWTARRIHRALFGQSIIDFSGESWTCLSHENNNTSKISNRCKHKSHACHTHILSEFTRQFSSTQSQATSHSMSNDGEWSDSTEPDHEAADSQIDDKVGDKTVCGGSGSAIRFVDSSQPPFKRPAEAFLANFDYPLQESDKISAPANTPRTEIFVLSPQ